LSSPTAAPVSKAASFYRPELDSLRFFAFLAVFVCHALPGDVATYQARHLPQFVATISRTGAFGVDLFFLLSAYLITSLLTRERERSGTIHLRAFYLRRILRIWPLYFFALGIAAVWPFVQPGSIMPWRYLLAYVLLSGNWMTALFGAPSSFMSILWSVSVEEQFYLTWPLLLRSFPLRWMAGLMIAVAWSTRIWLASGPLTAHTVSPNTFARLDTIAVGILLAGINLQRGILTRVLLLLGGMVTWVGAASFPETSKIFVIAGYPLVTVGSAMLFLSFLGARVDNGKLVYLGKISYGLYVYHVLALTIARSFLGGTGTLRGAAAYTAVGFALTVAFAALSYRWLEAPALRLKERFTYVPSRPI
jgi:peptidoglycan/LPS O-acetylase OafA/YrhL